MSFWNVKDAIASSMTQKYIGAALRAGLIAVGAVTAKNVDDSQITQLAGALMAIASVAWSMYEKHEARAVLMVPLAAANMTENTAKAMVADPNTLTPDVSTHPDIVPTPTVVRDHA